jgi:hypothetical protein
MVPDNAYEQAIVDRYSTPGLRRNQLDRAAKRDHLAGLKLPAHEVAKIMAELYGDDEPPKG